MDDRHKSPLVNRLITVTGLASAALIGWMNLVDAEHFHALLPNFEIPDFMAGGYDVAYLVSMREALKGATEAADVIRHMHLTADMVSPLMLGLFMGLLILRHITGSVLFGRVMTSGHILLLLLLPAGFVVSDYAENIVSLMYFPPSEPSEPLASQLASVLPWLTSLKFLFIAIVALLMVRQFLMIRIANKAEKS